MPNFEFENLLLDITQRFPPNVRWAVTCGCALALHGLRYEPSDLDFFAPVADMQRIAPHLDGLPLVFPLLWRTQFPFHSYFGRFNVDGIAVDFVGDFSVEYRGVRMAWDATHPCWSRLAFVQVDFLRVPVFALEDLLIFYLALPREERKIALIVEALRAQGFDPQALRDSTARWPVLREPLTALLKF